VTTNEYLYDTEETNRIRELAMGTLHEPPAPFFSHQSVAFRIARLMADHVEPRMLGRVGDCAGGRHPRSRARSRPAAWRAVRGHRTARNHPRPGVGARSGRRGTVAGHGAARPHAEARVVPAVRCARMLARGPAPGARHRSRFDGALPGERTATGGDAIQSSVLPGLEATVFL